MAFTIDLLTRLGDKFTVGDGCWEWTAGKNTDGYGRYKHQNKVHMAHRGVYELMVGLIPDGLTLDHLCRNRACVRPDHLEPCTLDENTKRSPIHKRNRTHCPQGHPYSGDNLYTYPTGNHRGCKACVKIRRERGK